MNATITCGYAVLYCGCLLAAVFVAPTFAIGQKPAPTTRVTQPVPEAWVTRAWTGDDKPFLEAENGIKTKISLGYPSSLVLAQARQYARKQPADFMAQFCWLYAATQAASDFGDFDYKSAEAVARQDPGNIRAVARIRFAAGVLQSPDGYHPDLDQVGKRLLATDPHDQWVHGHLIYDMANGVGVYKAQELAVEWIKQEPNSLDSHAVLAYVYQNLWAVSHHKRIYAEKAIAEQKEFLRLAPANDPGRKVATYLISAFQRRLSLAQ